MLNEQEKQDVINIFLLWLTESGVMTPFRKDIEKVKGVRDKEGFENLIKKEILDHPNTTFNRGLNNMLNMSFGWADSPHGFDYWDDTDCEYRKCAKDYIFRYQINRCSPISAIQSILERYPDLERLDTELANPCTP